MNSLSQLRLINEYSVLKMAKFCANLTFMFDGTPFLEKYQLAKEAGFKAVESGFPFGLEKEQVVNAKKKSGLEQVLINIHTGDLSKGELGHAAIPGKELEFKKSLKLTLEYVKDLNVKKVHVMSGKIDGEVTVCHDNTYLNNLKYAANVFEKANILGLIEPINSYSVPDYYMNDYTKALNVVKQINSPNLKIMVDVFHLQHLRGNITNTVRDLKNHIGHVQIAQVPNRNEPDAVGELNYKYVLDMIRKEGYTDWIGLEYKHSTSNTEGLKWIEQFGYSL